MTMFRRYMDVKMIFDPRQYMTLEKNSKLIKFCYTFRHLRRGCENSFLSVNVEGFEVCTVLPTIATKIL